MQIHDWLLEDATYNADNGSIHMHDIYGAIIEKACVCDGFSYAFKYVADMADIPVITVIGTGVTRLMIMIQKLIMRGIIFIWMGNGSW